MLNRRLKICFIGWASSEHVKRWVQWFARKGHEVHLISNVHEDISGVQVHSFSKKSGQAINDSQKKNNFITDLITAAKLNYLSYLRYPGYIRQAKRLLAEIDPDVLQGFYIGFAGYIGAFLNRHPFMVLTGGPDIFVFPQRSLFHRLWTKYALSKIDYLIHTSEEANRAVVGMGFPAVRSRSIHIGIDIQKFNSHVDPGPLKESLGIAGKKMILSTRGLFDKYYNISGLLKTFRIVSNKMPDARLVLKYYSAPEKDKFIKLARELGIYDKIVWVGKVDHSELPKYYRAADVYVSLAFTDSGPVSMLEAMSCGCVPVVTNLKNIAEWISNGKNGYLVKPDDHGSAARAIIEIISDPKKKAVYGARNESIIRERADQEKCFWEIEEITYRLIKEKR